MQLGYIISQVPRDLSRFVWTQVVWPASPASPQQKSSEKCPKPQNQSQHDAMTASFFMRIPYRVYQAGLPGAQRTVDIMHWRNMDVPGQHRSNTFKILGEWKDQALSWWPDRGFGAGGETTSFLLVDGLVTSSVGLIFHFGNFKCRSDLLLSLNISAENNGRFWSPAWLDKGQQRQPMQTHGNRNCWRQHSWPGNVSECLCDQFGENRDLNAPFVIFCEAIL